MWVYGDAERSTSARAFSNLVAAELRRADALPFGLARHAALVRVFVDASALIQGLIDRDFNQRGFDAPTAGGERLTRLLFSLACFVARSWTTDFADQALPDALVQSFAELGQTDDAPLTVRSAEGYSIYALYPETYLHAARASGLGSETIVIGIRSIGLSLAALVAAALGAKVPISLRPVGDPFGRRIAADDALLQAIRAMPDAPIAIVDEGPGLSGSSFFAVADWLEGAGITRNRLHFFPSHHGEPGKEASPDHRQRWHEAPRHVGDFDEVVSAERLEDWVRGVVGPLNAPLRDISGGAWKAEGMFLPVDARLERRKFLACTAAGSFLVKFAGLGSDGSRKLQTAQALFAAGFGPEPVALVHGLLVERWVEGEPLTEHNAERDAVVNTLGRYLGFRAENLPADNTGASLQMLADVAAFNSSRAFGAALDTAVRRLTTDAEALQTLVRPVDTDNRMHQWEWRVLPDKRLIKTDALDHSSSHDLVGCQDIAWDIAGAVVEHALTPGETQTLLRSVEAASGRTVDQRLLSFLLPCYLGFQAGLWSMARDAAADTERPAISAQLQRYERHLQSLSRE